MQKKIILIALLCLGVLMAILTFGASKEIVNKVIYPSLPDFEVEYLTEDKVFNTEEMKDKTWVMNIWASWCGPCRTEFPLLKQIKEQSPASVEWVGINYSDKRGSAIEWLKTQGYMTGVFDIQLHDANQALRKLLNLRGVPETLLVQNGQIIYRHARDIRNQEEANELLKRIQEAVGK